MNLENILNVDLKDRGGFSINYMSGIFLGLCVSLGLAAAYVFTGGIELVGNPAFAQLDSYAFGIALFTGSIVSASYLAFFKDLTEALAIEITVFYGLFSGLEDFFVYMFCIPAGKCGYPTHLNWLGNTHIGMFANLIGAPEITFPVLIGSILFWAVPVLLILKILYMIQGSIAGKNIL